MRVFHAVVLLAAMLIGVVAHPGGDRSAYAASKPPPKESKYVWTRVTARAVLPGGANYPIFVQGPKAYAFHPDGTWSTTDGRSWRAESLPDSKLNTAYLKYIQHAGAIYALGAMKGSYSDFTIDPVIRRTSDFRRWETIGRSSNLPERVFYSAVSFRGSLWILGGDDGKTVHNDVWRSTDGGLNWTQVLAAAPWSPRTGATAFVYRNRLWLIGGDNGHGLNNDVWFTTDGLEWVQATAEIYPQKPYGYATVIYDNKIWLMAVDGEGAKNGRLLVSEDGARWRQLETPWAPLSGVASWVMNDALFMTGGSLMGERDTVYNREVWRMEK